ncbi:hypothetical protein GWI33_007238 [Rhynchophorus ferrugineus]|uniref:Uncharacterized protein n=1 Tax=Rhynchophorus ferrugineus TaxID=354439 RepID=A0A834ID29_RHYFE|nr:hypothetical protein GWI33_007238 [Rhynchophorus ferrugineus]
MTKISVAFLLISLLLFIVLERTESSDIGTNKEKPVSPMWFGPRIGRRKRNEDNYRNEKDPDNFLDIDTPFYIAAREASSSFIPRMGRDSGESLNGWLDNRDFVLTKPVSNRASSQSIRGLGRVIQKSETSGVYSVPPKEKQETPIWFGPRIGRRKRNHEPTNQDDENDEEYFIDTGSPLVLTLRDSKKHFIPRLGRNSEENWHENPEAITSRLNRATYFTNRNLTKIGYSQIYPRLGRELD